jgi:hypothetical protein
VTGYIAGDALHLLQEKHSDWDYTCLVRTEDKAKIVKEAYPNVKIVLGDLEASSILEAEAAKADIVLREFPTLPSVRYLTVADAADASDHEGAAKAIAAGLVKGHSSEKPGYWLHTGGTGILTYTDSKDDFAGLGKWTDKEYNDLSGIEELTSLPDEAFHRNIDKIVLETGVKRGDAVKTVIVCPPTIYVSQSRSNSCLLILCRAKVVDLFLAEAARCTSSASWCSRRSTFQSSATAKHDGTAFTLRT